MPWTMLQKCYLSISLSPTLRRRYQRRLSNPCQHTRESFQTMTSTNPTRILSNSITSKIFGMPSSNSSSSAQPDQDENPRPNAQSTSSFPILYILFVLIFLIALFPPLFHALWTLPLKLLLPSTYSSALSPARYTKPAIMSWTQKTISLPSKSRGSYLVTDHIVSSIPEIKNYKVGLLNLFIQHTSCAISLNENWDEDVRADMSDALDRIAPEDRKGELYRHSAEGLDDMPVCTLFLCHFVSRCWNREG